MNKVKPMTSITPFRIYNSIALPIPSTARCQKELPYFFYEATYQYNL